MPSKFSLPPEYAGAQMHRDRDRVNKGRQTIHIVLLRHKTTEYCHTHCYLPQTDSHNCKLLIFRYKRKLCFSYYCAYLQLQTFVVLEFIYNILPRIKRRLQVLPYLRVICDGFQWFRNLQIQQGLQFL